MRTPLFLVALTLSACDNALPKDPTLDQNVDPGGEPQPDTGEEPAVDLDGDGYTADEDCNDDNDAIFPGAEEVCDGVDNDCDDRIDDNDDDVVGETITLYEDRDGDGFGDPDRVMAACVATDGYVEDATDCDDNRADVGGPTEWYEDHDLDGYAGPDFEVACIQPADTYATTEDCDDDDPGVNPGAEDLCGDDIDSDCGGEDDWAGCTDVEPADLIGSVTCTEEAGAFTAAGDHIQVNYGPHGMWWDDESTLAGLEVDPNGTGAWVDVTYPGIPLDQLFVERDARAYTIGSPSGDTIDDLTLLCSTPVAVGDVVGAVHRYKVDGPMVPPLFVLTKTELWNRSSQSMLVHFEIANSILAADTTFSLQRITDPDQDDPTTDVLYVNPPSDPLLTAEGPVSGLTIGVGRCSFGAVTEPTAGPHSHGNRSLSPSIHVIPTE